MNGTEDPDALPWLEIAYAEQAGDVFGETTIMTRASRAKANLDFDAWLRARTDSAHAAYMAQHSAGGQAY